jgi:hypothetical protein
VQTSSTAQPNIAQEIHRIRDAVRHYHSVLTQSETPSSERRARFEDDMLAEKLDYGARMLCASLRPHLISRPLHDFVESVTTRIVRTFHKVGRAALSHPELQAALGLTPEERDLVAIDPRSEDISALSRLDAFVSEEGLNLVEYNGESPTGVAYNERLFRVFDRLEAMAEFRQQIPLETTGSMEDMLDVLLTSYRDWGGTEEPRVAIVDWKEVVTRGEFEIFAEYFRTRGVPTRIVDPHDLEVVNDRLVAHGETFNIVYRRLLTSEFLERRGECLAFEQAYRRQLACFVNNFRAKLVHKKLIFSIFWDPLFEGLLTLDELRLGQQHVPWTARVKPGRVLFEDIDQDLETMAVERQADLVLKPNDDYGGKGLMLGAEMAPEAWRRGLQQALESGVDNRDVWVLQRRIPLFQEDFPDLDGQIATYYVDLDPFFFRDKMNGFLTRMSTQSISNVTTGGGQIPTYVIP